MKSCINYVLWNCVAYFPPFLFLQCSPFFCLRRTCWDGDREDYGNGESSGKWLTQDHVKGFLVNHHVCTTVLDGDIWRLISLNNLVPALPSCPAPLKSVLFFFVSYLLTKAVCTVCAGSYVGLWAWLRLSLFSGWTKVRDRVASDPRFDVVLPPPVRRVLHWIFRLDSKVTYYCTLLTYYYYY